MINLKGFVLAKLIELGKYTIDSLIKRFKHFKRKTGMNIAQTLEKLKNEGYEPLKPADIQDVCLFLLGLDMENLKKVINDKSLPMIFRIIGRELLSEKGFEIVEKLLNRIYGKEFSAEGGKDFSIHLVDVKLPEPEPVQNIYLNAGMPKELRDE